MASQDGELHNEASRPERISAGTYLSTRLSTLKPPMTKAPNPIKLVRLLNKQQWLFFLVAFFAWSWDAFDFFTVSLTVEQLAEDFDKAPSQITWGITLVLSKFFISMGEPSKFGLTNDFVQCSDP